MDRLESGLKKNTDSTNRLFGDNQNHVEFYSQDNFFKVVIKNANWIAEPINDNLDQNTIKVLNYIKEHVKCTREEIAKS